MKYVLQLVLLILTIAHFSTINAGTFYFKKTSHNQAKPVPEMDVAVAPLAGALLISLIAAGAERRRRKNKKLDQ
jgi:hypothetical protein